MISVTEDMKRMFLPRVAVCGAITILSMVVASCSGGLVGTSTGPDENSGNTVILPKTLSPRIPDSLLRGEGSAIAPGVLVDADSVTDLEQSWQQLSPYISQIEYTRVALQLELQLLQSVFDEVLNLCGELTSTACEIPAGEIRATYTQDISNIISGNNDESGRKALPLEQLLAIGDEIVFGEIHVQKNAETPYDYRLIISPLSLLPDETLQMDWSAEFSEVRYSIGPVGSTLVDRYRYQRLSNAHRVIVNGVIVDVENQQRPVALEVIGGAAGGRTAEGGTVLFNAHVAGNNIRGRATDNNAHTSSFSDLDNENTGVEQPVGAEGGAIDYTLCKYSESVPDCLEGELTSDNQFIPVEQVESAVSEYEFEKIIVKNLPFQLNTVDYFEIRRYTDAQNSDEFDLLCLIYRHDNPRQRLEVISYCFDDAASVKRDGIVVAIDTDANSYVVDDAIIEIVRH